MSNQTLVTRFAVCVALLISPMHSARAGEGQPDRGAAEIALSADFNNWNQLQSLLPVIRDGQVKGDHPKSVELLRLAIADYQSRVGGDVKSISYFITAGSVRKGRIATDVSAFRLANGPTASYALAIGDDIDGVDTAAVLVYTTSGNKAESATIFAAWVSDGKVGRWVPWHRANEGEVAPRQIADEK